MSEKMTNINVKIHTHIKDQIVAHAEELGYTSSEFIRHLITNYFADRHAQNQQHREAVQRRLNHGA